MGMDLMPYFALSSLLRGDDMIFLLMWEGAWKWRFLRFLAFSEMGLFTFDLYTIFTEKLMQDIKFKNLT